jgi:hypothetical protein
MPKRNALQCPNISVYTSCRKMVNSTVPQKIRTKLNDEEQSIVENSIPKSEKFPESESKLSQKSNKNKEYLQPDMEYIADPAIKSKSEQYANNAAIKSKNFLNAD